ncbi:hypothetical protein [Clostridium malenominatum]
MVSNIFALRFYKGEIETIKLDLSKFTIDVSDEIYIEVVKEED